jgi:hypothetical protein
LTAAAHFGRFLSGLVSISLCALLLVSACTVLPGSTKKRIPHIGVLVGTRTYYTYITTGMHRGGLANTPTTARAAAFDMTRLTFF